MEGVLLASASSALRGSLAAILRNGRTVHECSTVSESLALAAAHKMDYIFVDDVFEDGDGEGLVQRLSALGYGIEIVPILLSSDPIYLQPFRTYGVRYCVSKPFDVNQVLTVVQQIEELVKLSDEPHPLEQEMLAGREVDSIPTPQVDYQASPAVDVREISQRFRRLLARSLSREELIQVFADCMQEQFDVDNVVILLPVAGRPAFRITVGNVSDEIRNQFFIPFNEPLIANLIRLGEPVWVYDRDRLGRANAVTALRYGERLGIQVLCPVLSRGRALALVGLSRFHRYSSSPVLVSLLRLFLTFFAKALENAELYDKAATARKTYRTIVDAMPMGTLAVNHDGQICHLNPSAEKLLGLAAADVVGQQVERAGSLVADVAREVLYDGEGISDRNVNIRGVKLLLSGVPMNLDEEPGVLLLVQTPAVERTAAPEKPDSATSAHSEEVLARRTAAAIAHNFKNALVPVKTCAELLPERFDEPEFRDSFFRIAGENIGKIDGWIEKLLRYSAVKEEKRNRRVAGLHVIVDAALQNVQERNPDINVTVEKDFVADDQVSAEVRQLEQAFTELIANAFDTVRTKDEPRLWLKTAVADDGAVCAEVRDNGAGVDSAVNEELFEPFTTNKLSGLGLGLAYCRKVVELHGGQVRHEQVSGGGSVFRVVLQPADVKESVAQNNEAGLAAD